MKLILPQGLPSSYKPMTSCDCSPGFHPAKTKEQAVQHYIVIHLSV